MGNDSVAGSTGSCWLLSHLARWSCQSWTKWSPFLCFKEQPLNSLTIKNWYSQFCKPRVCEHSDSKKVASRILTDRNYYFLFQNIPPAWPHLNQNPFTSPVGKQFYIFINFQSQARIRWLFLRSSKRQVQIWHLHYLFSKGICSHRWLRAGCHIWEENTGAEPGCRNLYIAWLMGDWWVPRWQLVLRCSLFNIHCKSE